MKVRKGSEHLGKRCVKVRMVAVFTNCCSFRTLEFLIVLCFHVRCLNYFAVDFWSLDGWFPFFLRDMWVAFFVLKRFSGLLLRAEIRRTNSVNKDLGCLVGFYVPYLRSL